MLSQKFSKTFDIGDGREVTIETGRLARQADGAVTVKMGNNILLATVVATEEPKPGQDDTTTASASRDRQAGVSDVRPA